MVERSRMLNVRVSEDEMAMLQAVAEAIGLSQSDTVRQLIRRAYVELPGSSGQKRRKAAPKRR